MIPVTVDAPQYLSHRKKKSVDQEFSRLLTRSITNPEQGQRRGGLGITVGLPKRLNRIFGEGGAGLRVSGYRRIMFSGRSQWTDAAESDVYSQSKFPSLSMEQTYRFDINGTIGTKISVKVSEDSRQNIPLANRLIIRYKGDEDDVLKSIEAGNTTLSLPNTKFVGYSSSIRGLFGVKSEAQIGKLRLIGIASQEQGSSESVSISPTGEESAEYTRDYDYAQARIFDLGDSTSFEEGDSVITLYVYEQVLKRDNSTAQDAILKVDPNSEAIGTEDLTFVQGSDALEQIDEVSYSYFSDPVRKQHYVVFNSGRRQGRALGIYMEVLQKANGSVYTVGNISPEPGQPLLLKLLYHSAPSPQHQTWNLMWRNCYNIPRGISVDDIEIKVFRGSTGNEGSSSSFEFQESEGRIQNYIEILGLDQYNERDQKLPDGRFDERLEIFRPDWGLLIFPHRTPFDPDTSFVDANGVSTDTLEMKAPLIYNYESSEQKTQSSRYYIQLVTKARSSIIPLGHANIIEGSERVIVNGRLLERGTDYNIRYDFGQLTLTSDEAMDPNADIDIQFEYAPFLAVQKKTLLGMRAEYEWSKNLEFGTTVLYKSDKAQDRKPRVGQETARAVIYDVDGSWRTKANFLTSLVDALPLIETESPSSFRIEGELAQSRPNPNVDGVAYVDDFEAAQEQLSLGLQRTNWKAASLPVQVDTANWGQGKILWHAPKDPLDVREVWNVDPKQGEGTIRTLRLVFRPDTIQSWAGIMRGFYQRIDAQRVQLLELRAKVSEGAQGKLHIDIGTINEDMNGDEIATNEDKNNNGVVDEEEDVGLDGKADEAEDGYDENTNPDPNGDNWYFMGEGKCPLPSGECDKINWGDESIRYEWLNGTEGNLLDPGWLGIPDEETLTRRGQVRANAYFSYVIDLGLDIDSFRVEGSERNGWWTYRIPIRDSLALDTIVLDVNPDTGDTLQFSWNEVTHVRVWFESEASQTQNDTVEIAAWYFVQSNWQDSVLYGEESDSSTSFVVASISEEDNTFDPPPGVEPYKDPNYNVTEAQRGLLLQFDSLTVGDTCLAVKNLISADKYSGYRQLEMYVYGGDIEPAGEGKVMFFFRLGKDGNNFYEQRRLIYSGWDERNHISFDFNEITGLKDAALITKGRTKWNEIDTTDGSYRVRGNPNINDVKFFAAGIINIDNVDSARLTGEIWLDELRVTEVRKDVGTAARISVGGTIADLMSYNFSFQSQDAFFRGLSSATRGGSSNNLGSGKTTTLINYGGSLSFHKFLPRSWGANIPISLSHSKTIETPLLRSNSDIVLPEEIREKERSISESNSFRISESFNRKGKNPLFNLLLNRFNTSLSYSCSRRKTVTILDAFGENYSVSSNFNLGVSKPPTLPIFFWTNPLPLLKKTSGSRLGLYPSAWTLTGNYNRNLSITKDISEKLTSSLTRGFTGTMSLKYKVFDNLTTSFSYSTTRDLSDTGQVNLSLKNFRLGLETQYGQSFSASYNPNLLSFLTSSFSYKSNYRDTYSRSSQSRQSAMSRSWSVNGKFEHIKFLGRGKPDSPGRRSGRHRGGESGEEGGEEKPKSGKPFYDPPLAVLRFLTGWIQPLSYSYNEGFSTTLPGMLARPKWKYRFGFGREAEVATVSEGRTPSSGEDKSYQLGSGFSFLGGLSTTVAFRQKVTRDIVKQGSRYKNVSTSWPDLNISIRKFQSFPLIKGLINKFIDVFSPRTNYGRQIKEQYDIVGGFLRSRSVSISHSPLLSVNFKVLRSLSLSSTYTLTKSEDEKYNPTTGAFQSQTRTERKSIGVTTSYKFSAPGGISVPLFGKIRFKSTMSISLDVKKNASKSETKRTGEGWVISTDKADFSVNTNISYTFSQQIKGGLSAGWQDSSDNFRNRNNHSRTLEGWVEIRF